MVCSPPDSSVPGILQSRILEWVAMPSSRGSSQPRLFKHLFHIGWAMFVFVLGGIDSFHLSCEICISRITHCIPYYPFEVCRVCSDITCFIADIGSLCLLSLFISLAKGFSISLIFSKHQFFASLNLFIVCNFTNFCSYIHYFFLFICIYFVVLSIDTWGEILDYWFETFPLFFCMLFNAINFPLSTVLAVSTPNINVCCLSCNSVQCIFI